ncbi:MAG: oxidoreductase [Armatimonadetes bacterium]|nr:oxidoreductase [Armatimonadota bacterium]
MIYTNVGLAFLVLLAGSLAVGSARSWRSGGWVAAAFVATATILAWADGLKVLVNGRAVEGFVFALPGFGSQLAVMLDPLGAGFLMVITAVSLIATIYSVGYMGFYKKESPRRFYSLLQLFIAGMIGVVAVADWLFFIVLWELMTLASYFLVTFERSDPRAVRAGFKYFIMTHVATAGLLVSAIVLWSGTGSWSFQAHGEGLGALSVAMRGFLLALYLIAFSTKAGIFPMGDWLPDAHPAAPSGVSAILSGVMIKLGAYGVIRVFWDVLPGVGTASELTTWGLVIVFLGTLSAFVGGVTAMKENDAKRLLAFSSISQMGYIFLALGIAVAFSVTPGMSLLVMLALLAAGFHILNDAIYKSLLFMNAGSILYSTGTRDINKVGGLAVVMPAAAAAGLVGVASLSGLPPMNGFASKWLIYQASISGGINLSPLIVAAVVAFFVGLSTLAYSLKYFNIAFLGKPAASSGKAVPIPLTMTFAQVVPALACILIGLLPFRAIGAVSSAMSVPSADMFGIGRVGGLMTVASGGAVSAIWSPIVLFGLFLIFFVLAEVLRASGRASMRVVSSWYGGEEHLDDEVRFRAKGFYSPFNEAFAHVYPRLAIPRLPSLGRIRAALDLDKWLYGPALRGSGRFVDKVSRSHIGVPQIYMIWQVAGMIVVVALLFALVK